MKNNERKKWDAAKIGVIVGFVVGILAASSQFERRGASGPAWDILLGYFVLNFVFWGALGAAICWIRNRIHFSK